MDLEAKFRSLRDLLLPPRTDSAVRTDNSILVVYPPEEEHDFRDHLHKLLEVLKTQGVPHSHLDLTGLPFEALEESGRLPDVYAQECEDLRAVKRGLAGILREALRRRIEAAAEVGEGTVLLSGSMALYPVIKFADVLSELRHLPCRIVLAFPGHERDGKLYFMNQRDGYNYLAVKLS